ncbi:MAG TPA: redoxin family protein [Polyangiales bacterium]
MHARSRQSSALALFSLFALLACQREQAKPVEQTAQTAVPEHAPVADKKAAAPAALPSPAELAKAAPDFTLSDTDGKSYALSELRGKTVVLEWFNPDCPFIKFAHGKGPLVDMAAKVQSANLVWLSINSSAPGKQGHGRERNAEARMEYKMSNPVLLDESGAVGRAYGAQKTPHVFVIDARGVLVYRGGVDNAPMGVPDAERPRPEGSKEGDLVPYLTNALADLAANRQIALADTPAYGCSVKYKE